jgi:glycerol-3-phosphate dehydrogenase (NAD(P)+)
LKAIAILGAGSWGTALSTLPVNCSDIRLWEREPGIARKIQQERKNDRYLPEIDIKNNVYITSSLEDALANAEAVVFAVPSGAMAEVVELSAEKIPADALIVNAAKGLECSSGKRMSEVISEGISAKTGETEECILGRLSVLSGPNLAVEIARGMPGASVAASSSEDTARLCQSLWMGPSFRVYTSLDIIGVELAGAMKNVIAIGAGICEGAGFGDNSRAALMTRGLAEITRLGAALGADRSTFLGLAGVGDLIATGGSRLSRNYRLGIALALGKTLEQALTEIGQVAEGAPTTRAICTLARKVGSEMPISQVLYSTLFEGLSVSKALSMLMMRPPVAEQH